MAKNQQQVHYPLMLDPLTGESRTMTQDEYNALQKQAKAIARKENAVNAPPKVDTIFFRVYKTNWSDLVRNGGLTYAQIGIFCSLMAFVDWGTNRVVNADTGEFLSISSLAKLLRMDRKYLSDVLHVLEGKGLVALQVRGSTTYVLLNPHVMWFGKHMSNMPEHNDAFFYGNEVYHPVVYVDYQEPRPK